MSEDFYTIKVDNTEVAKHVSLEYACIFLKAIMREYYNEIAIGITIERERSLSEYAITDLQENKK